MGILRAFCDFEKKKEQTQSDFQKEVERNEFTISTYGGTEECEESNANMGETKELINQIELRLGSDELRAKSNDWEEDKDWKTNEETKRQKEVEGILPTIQEEDGAGSVSGGMEVVSQRNERRRFRPILEVMGISAIFQINGGCR